LRAAKTHESISALPTQGEKQMIQEQRIAEMAQAAGITYDQAKVALKALYGTIATDLCQGERVRMPLVGSLVAIPIASHPGRNPGTGEAIIVAARRKIRFTPSGALKKGLAASPAKAAAE
jgi:DNA-binding protein HU-beta